MLPGKVILQPRIMSSRRLRNYPAAGTSRLTAARTKLYAKTYEMAVAVTFAEQLEESAGGPVVVTKKVRRADGGSPSSFRMPAWQLHWSTASCTTAKCSTSKSLHGESKVAVLTVS